MSRLRKLVLGIGWGGISTIVMAGFQLVFMAVMARLLEPADFGLVAIANVTLRFLSYFAQMGIAPAIIQKPQFEDGDIGAAFSVSLMVSSIFCLIAVVMSPLAERFFAMHQLASLMQVLALNFIIGGVSAISTGLLRREYKFKKLAQIEIVSYVIGYGAVGLVLAYGGAGVWALVGAITSQAVLTLVFSYAVTRHTLNFRHTTAQRNHFLGFGSRYSIIGFLEFLTANLDALIIGKFFGASSAGVYNRALLIANLPVQQPANVLTRALFPILSSLPDQRDKQAVAFQLSTLAVGGYAFAVSAGVAIAAPDLVKALLGQKWLDAIPVLQILALSVGQIFVSHVAGVTLDALGELSAKLKIQFLMFITLLILIYLLLPHGLTGIAMAIVINESLRMVVMWATLARKLTFTRIEQWLIIRVIVCSAIVSGGLVYFAYVHIPIDFPVVFRVIGEVVAGIVGTLITAFVCRRMIARLHAINVLVLRLPIIAKYIPISRTE